MTHNGNKIQVGITGFTDEDPYLNYVKGGSPWTFGDQTNHPARTLGDTNGYPTGGTLTNLGWLTNFKIPTQHVRSGIYVFGWTDTGTFANPFDTLLTGNLTDTNGRITGSFADSSGNTLQVTIRITATGTGTANAKNWYFCHVNDEAALLAGGIFHQAYIDTLKPFGVLRFMDAQYTNASTVINWADRKPQSYWSYTENYYPPAACAGTLTYDGVDTYTGSLAGFTLTDKARVICRFSVTQTVEPSYINLNGLGKKEILNSVGSHRTGVLGNFLGPVVADIEHNCIYDNGLNGFIVQGDINGSVDTGIVVGMPVEVCVALCNAVGAHCYLNVGMHALDGDCTQQLPTIPDYTNSMAAYCAANLNQGLILFVEPANEVWNSTFAAQAYGAIRQQVRSGIALDSNNWYGMAVSLVGQAVSAAYGNDRTRYEVVNGQATYGGGSSTFTRLDAPYYVSQGGSAAKNWCTAVAITGYWQPNCENDARDAADETEYAAAVTAGDTAKQAYILARHVASSEELGVVSASGSLTEVPTEYGLWATFAARSPGMKLIQYEGGFGAATTSAVHLDERFSPLIRDYTIRNWKNFFAAGGVWPAEYVFVAAGGINAMADNRLQVLTAPRYLATLDFNTPPGGKSRLGRL